MQVKGGLVQPFEHQTGFSKAPEALDAIDVGFVPDEPVTTMINTEMFTITNIHKAIVTTPSAGVDDTFWFDFPSDNSLQRGLGAVRRYFGVDFAITLEDPEDNCFTVGATPSLSFNPTRAKISPAMLLAECSRSFTNSTGKSIDGAAIESSQFRDLSGFRIESKRPHQLTKF